MAGAQIDRACRAADSLLGGSPVREFASAEFPHEDYHWVAAQVRDGASCRGASPGLWARLRRLWTTPGKVELNAEPTPEPAPA
ncbi:MAG TPA: hypothetical protein VEY07_08845 [Thermoplasmata archaeon]|nr:hypothetical protein [Thermoplasmata archaeon]